MLEVKRMEVRYMKNAEIYHGNQYPIWMQIPNTPINIRIDPFDATISVSHTVKIQREFYLSSFKF